MLNTNIEQIATVESNLELELPERPSPDGEEGETPNKPVEQLVEENLDTWEDWEISVNNRETALDSNLIQSVNLPQSSQTVEMSKRKQLRDISELDIKMQVDVTSMSSDYDFFQDMEPIIETSPIYFVAEGVKEDSEASSKLINMNLNVTEVEKHVEGWGDEYDWE